MKTDLQDTGDSARCAMRGLLAQLGWKGDISSINRAISNAALDHDLNMGAEAAEEWGKEYLDGLTNENTIQRIAIADSSEVNEEGGLVALVRKRQHAVAGNRLSRSRVMALCDPLIADRRGRSSHLSDTEYDRFIKDVDTLCGFGEEGVRIITGSSFVAEARRGRHSPSYNLAPSAVMAHIHKSRIAGNGIIIDEQTANSIAGRNEIRCGWTKKKGKACGRITNNCSGNSVNSKVGKLNDDEAKAIAAESWGPIENPTLGDIVRMINEAAKRWGREKVVVWKTDLRGAFTLLKFHPEDTKLMTTRITGNLFFVATQGNFGWASMGFAFQVVTRVILVCVRAVIAGLVVMYTDDLIGVGQEAEPTMLQVGWIKDRDAAVEVMKALLGSDAEEPAKREDSGNVDRSITVIGWLIMLKTWTVDVADHNATKALYLFDLVEQRGWASLKEVEAIASLAYRYSQIFPELGVLTGDLYSLQNAGTRRAGKVVLSKSAVAALRLWVAYLTWTAIKREEGCTRGRSLDAFRIEPASIIIEFDGSLEGIGFRIIRMDGEVVVAVGARRIGGRIQSDGDKNESQYQNCMEMAALTCGVVMAVSIGFMNCTIHARGDSVSILSWVSGGRNDFKSTRARAASMVFVGACQHADLIIDSKYSWISSEDNHVCDDLSRGRLPNRDVCGKHGVQWSSRDSLMGRTIELCDPTLIPTDESDFLERWAVIGDLLRQKSSDIDTEVRHRESK